MQQTQSLIVIKKKSDAIKVAYRLSVPTKLPCKSYSLPANRCITGMKITKTKNSTCSECYATTGYYTQQHVKNALEKRLEAISHPQWVEAMVKLISGMPYFRWHDSGDLQGVKHLSKIIQIVKQTPTTKHWLPTREYGMVRSFVEHGGVIPGNLVIRLSATFYDKDAPIGLAKRLDVQTSKVSSSGKYDCPAYDQGHKCLDCRKCWDADVFCITYKKTTNKTKKGMKNGVMEVGVELQRINTYCKTGLFVNQKLVNVIHPEILLEGLDSMSQKIVDSIRLEIIKKRELQISLLEIKRDNINQEIEVQKEYLIAYQKTVPKVEVLS